jgi:hypothetical protein
VFRALEHEGVAAECLFHLFAGERRMTSEHKLHAFTACAVMAKTMKVLRGK